jgi:transposase
MKKKNRTKHSPEFKAKVALAALREQESIVEIARRHKVHPNIVHKWKRQLSENISRAFETEGSGGGDATKREAELLRKIGELTVERDFLARGLDRLQ